MIAKKSVITDRNHFEDIKKYLQDTKSNFNYYTSGSVNKIIYKDKEYMFVELSGNSGKGHHLSRKFKKDVDDWLIKHGDTLEKHQSNYSEQMFNLGAIESVIGKPIVSIDINDCYWKTAYKLGYITERTYIEGKRKKEWKTGRNACIGSLCKTETIVPYINGIADYSLKKVIRPEIEYQYIRNHIIGYVYKSFYRLHQDIGNKFYMFLTDCVFTDYRLLHKVQKFFNDDGYRVKDKPVEFLGVDRKNKVVTWFDFEAERKNEFGEVIGKGKTKYYIYAPHQVLDGVEYPAVNPNAVKEEFY